MYIARPGALIFSFKIKELLWQTVYPLHWNQVTNLVTDGSSI